MWINKEDFNKLEYRIQVLEAKVSVFEKIYKSQSKTISEIRHASHLVRFKKPGLFGTTLVDIPVSELLEEILSHLGATYNPQIIPTKKRLLKFNND